MNNVEIARRILAVSKPKGDNLFVGDIPQNDINLALTNGWLTPVGAGHFQVTEKCRLAGA